MNTTQTITEKLKFISLFSFIPILLLYIFLPSIFNAKIDSSSYASGILLFSLIIIGISYFFASQKIIHTLYSLKSIFYVIVLCVIYIFIHSILASALIGSFNYIRALGSLMVLLIMATAAFLFVLIINKTTESGFYISLWSICVLILILVFLSAMGFNPMAYSDLFTKPIFPFVEPSHFALFIAPFYFWAICTQNNKIKKFSTSLSLMLVLVFINNLTLGCIILIGLYLSLRLKFFLIIFCTLIILVIFFTQLDLTYYTERLDVQNDNLSTLVWIQGWEEAYINFKNTYGLGLGFQQLGIKDPVGDAANSIYIIFGDYLNRYDGGTMGAKLTSEFGVFGIATIVLICNKAVKSFKILVNHALISKKAPQLIFYHCCVITIVVELFIRSVGYMGPSFFMFMTGIIGLQLEVIATKKLSDK
jgi:hypothetical protein